jgi:hypothetical protein
MLTKRELAKILHDARADPIGLMEKTLWVQNKAGDVVRFILNAPQRKLHARVIAQMRAGRPIRFLILKARQAGYSTYVEALLFTWMLTRSYLRALVLTHERDLSQELAAKSGFFFEHLDPRVKPEGRAHLNRVHLAYFQCEDGTIPLNSRLSVDTATGKESGRGRTYQFLHMAEYAFYPDPKRAKLALMPTVPKMAGTAIFIESTANGIDSEFYRDWVAAERGEGLFEPFFCAWHEIEEYAIEPSPGFKATADEEEERVKYDLTDAQLYWRRVTIQDECAGDVSKFQQEYPGCPEEAFISSGNPAFNKKALIEYRRVAERLPPPMRGTLEPGDPPRFRRSEQGMFLIHHPPEEGGEYLIAADTALGVEDGDASALAVLNRQRNRIDATWWGRLEPRLLAHEMAKLGYLYNTALLAPETNNTGMTTLVELTHHLFYPRIYRWQRYDNLRNVYTDKLGWQTNVYSRPLLLDDMSYALNQHLIAIPSIQALSELMIFDSGTKRVADDDLAMAVLIVWHCHLMTPMDDGTMPRAILEKPKKDEPTAPTTPVDEKAWAAHEAFEREMRQASGRQSADVAALTDAEPSSWVMEDTMPWIPDC